MTETRVQENWVARAMAHAAACPALPATAVINVTPGILERRAPKSAIPLQTAEVMEPVTKKENARVLMGLQAQSATYALLDVWGLNAS